MSFLNKGGFSVWSSSIPFHFLLKLVYFSTVVIVGMCFVFLIPFARSLELFFAISFFSRFFLGGFAAVNFGHFVYTMGPIKSRPYTMAIHMLVGFGFLLGVQIVRPFLPGDEFNQDKSPQDVCSSANHTIKGQEETLTDDILSVVPEIWGLPSIYWPYLILSIVNIMVALAFLGLAFCAPSTKFSMPVFDSVIAKEDPKEEYSKLVRWIPFLFLVFIFYAISCGIERIFQSMVFTFGLCGPLSLSPSEANTSDSAYNGGFLAGRVVATLIAGFIRPRNMLIVSLGLCLVASIILAALGSVTAVGLYVASALVGFTISWQYGSAFSWTAQKLDITGIVASLFAASCGIGGMISVPIIGFLQSKANPSSFIWAVVILSCVHIIVLVVMWFVGNKLKKSDPRIFPRESNDLPMKAINED